MQNSLIVAPAVKVLKLKMSTKMLCKYSQIQYKDDISSLLLSYFPVQVSDANR